MEREIYSSLFEENMDGERKFEDEGLKPSKRRGKKKRERREREREKGKEINYIILLPPKS